MERTRVEDIKKKFEGLNQPIKKHVNNINQKGVVVSQADSQVDKHSCNILRGNIKRSHAFRSEKQVRPTFGAREETASLASCNNNKLPITRPSVVIRNADKEDNLQQKNWNRRKEFNNKRHVDSPIQSPSSSPQCTYSSVVKNTNKAKTRRKLTEESSSPTVNSNNPPIFKSPVLTKSIINQFEKGINAGLELKKENVDAFLDPCSTATKLEVPCETSEDDPIERLSKYYRNKQCLTKNTVSGSSNSARDFFSNMLMKDVLTAPLPRGPPPKKPPRTFAHNLESRLESKSNFAKTVKTPSSSKTSSNQFDKSDVKPVRSKTESQIMLKKLENYLLSHQSNSVAGKSSPPLCSTSNNENGVTVESEILKTKQFKKNVPLPSTPKIEDASKIKDFTEPSLCFNILSCAMPPVYESLALKKSNFFVQKPDYNLANENLQRSYGTIRRSVSEEHVYAEPLHSENISSNDVKTMGSVRNRWAKRHESLPESCSKLPFDWRTPEKSVDSGLHYMSTPINAASPLAADKENSKSIRFVDSVDKVGNARGKLNEAINSRVNLFNSLNLGPKSPSLTLSLNHNMTEQETPSVLRKTSDEVEGDEEERNSAGGIDRQKIQMLLNEAYAKCSSVRPSTADNGSDSDSIVSTPDNEQPHPSSAVVNNSSNLANHKTEPIIHHNLQHKDREQMTAERRVYVRRVSSRLASVRRTSHNRMADQFPHLFECLLLVGLDLDPARCKVPYIKSRFPENVQPPRIEELCFPDANDWPPPPSSGQSYAQVLTDSNGLRKFGYFRRVQPEGAAVCLPLAYCIITPFKANAFYDKVLMELESKHGQSDVRMAQFIEQLYCCPFPALGHGLFISDAPHAEKVEILRRPLDSRQEDTDLAELLAIVKLSVFLQIFATLLHERKVILLSESISKLSVCIEGLQASLFPFHWQHTLVPILPSVLMDVCDAPTPYLIGIIKPKLVDLPFNNLDLDLVVDVDEGVVIHSKGDEGWILPSRLSRGLRSALQLSLTSAGSGPLGTSNLLASEALLRLFVELVGHYREHISVSAQTKRREFQRDSFVKSVSSRSVQLFLEWFTETAMFNAFIQSRIERSADSRGIFEQRCSEFMEESDHGRLVKNYKALNKTVKTLGDRFKDWAALS